MTNSFLPTQRKVTSSNSSRESNTNKGSSMHWIVLWFCGGGKNIFGWCQKQEIHILYQQSEENCINSINIVQLIPPSESCDFSTFLLIMKDIIASLSNCSSLSTNQVASIVWEVQIQGFIDTPVSQDSLVPVFLQGLLVSHISGLTHRPRWPCS